MRDDDAYEEHPSGTIGKHRLFSNIVNLLIATVDRNGAVKMDRDNLSRFINCLLVSSIIFDRFMR